VTDPPKKRGRRPKPPPLPAEVEEYPSLRPADEREVVANFWRARMDQIEREHQQRVEILRTAGEHPSPVFAAQVKSAGALGLGKSVTCRLLGIAQYTLDTHYAADYELGTAEVISSVAANMIRIGTSTTDPANAKVGMDILSRRGGQEWRPPAQKLEVNDDREQPKNVIDSSKLTFDQRQELRRMIEYAQSGAEGDPLQPGETHEGVAE
jgi:hypothetical protein